MPKIETWSCAICGRFLSEGADESWLYVCGDELSITFNRAIAGPLAVIDDAVCCTEHGQQLLERWAQHGSVGK